MSEHGGHRKRILQKLKEGKLSECEYLEMLLFNALPRRNTSDLAHRLYSEFGNLKNVLDAPYERLIAVDGIGESVAAYIVCIGRVFRSYLRSKKEPKKMKMGIYDSNSFSDFVKREYADLSYERLDVYLLDVDSRIIGKKSSSLAHKGEVFADSQFFIEIFSTFEPSGIVLVHNHPCGNCSPSNADDQSTMLLQSLCEMHNVLFCDHFIYGLDGVYSYGGNNRLIELSEKLKGKRQYATAIE